VRQPVVETRVEADTPRKTPLPDTIADIRPSNAVFRRLKGLQSG